MEIITFQEAIILSAIFACLFIFLPGYFFYKSWEDLKKWK